MNGHPLGRFWSVGPQKTLYLPGPWLRKGANQIIIFDLDGKPGRSVWGDSRPMLDGAVSRDPLTAGAQ